MTLVRAPRFLAAAWLGLACYCLLSLVFGRGGFLASTSSGAELEAMRQNIDSLKDLNEGLSIEIAALQNDTDRAKREALPLGWLAKGDYEIVIEDRPISPRPELSVGKVLPASPSPGLADMDIKASSLIVSILALALSLFRDRDSFTKRAKSRKKRGQGASGEKKRKSPPRPATAAAQTPIAGGLA